MGRIRGNSIKEKYDMKEIENTKVQLIGELPEDYSKPSKELDNFREYIFRFNCAPCKQKREEFEKWALFIRKYGERCKMLKTYKVLCADDRHYWTMGDPMNTTYGMNRALINEPRRVPILEWLDWKSHKKS